MRAISSSRRLALEVLAHDFLADSAVTDKRRDIDRGRRFLHALEQFPTGYVIQPSWPTTIVVTPWLTTGAASRISNSPSS